MCMYIYIYINNQHIYIYIYIVKVTLTSARCDIVSQRADIGITLTVMALRLRY